MHCKLSYYAQASYFIYSSFKEKCIKIDYHYELKIFAHLLKDKLYINKLYIVYRVFIHFSSKEGYIKINDNCKLNIFASYLWGKVYQNQLLS